MVVNEAILQSSGVVSRCLDGLREALRKKESTDKAYHSLSGRSLRCITGRGNCLRTNQPNSITSPSCRFTGRKADNGRSLRPLGDGIFFDFDFVLDKKIKLN
jgi:hypothetical protein